MTAEIYIQDGDLAAATVRLIELGEDDPIHAVQAAILTAQELGYAQPDMQLLASLFTGTANLYPCAIGNAAIMEDDYLEREEAPRQPPWFLLTGVIVGLIIGLLISLLVIPVKYKDTAPAVLSAAR